MTRTFGLCLSGLDGAYLFLLQHLDAIEPRALRVDTACARHGNTRTLTESCSLIQLTLLYPLPAVLVDCQGVAKSDKLVVRRPGRQATGSADVVWKYPDQAVMSSIIYFGYCMMLFMLAI